MCKCWTHICLHEKVESQLKWIMMDAAEFVLQTVRKVCHNSATIVQLHFCNDEKKRQNIECSIIGAYVISLEREIEEF